MIQRIIFAVVAALSSGVLAANLVPEDKRNFDVPFKGEGKMGMQYVPVFFPKGTEGAVVSCEVKIADVVCGAQSWFDARIMTQFVDSQCRKTANGPTLGGWKGTKDWFAVRKVVKVPDGAYGLALMPCLFNVKSGAMAVRNLSVEPQEKFAEDPEDRARREASDRKKAAAHDRRQAQAQARLARDGALVPPQGEAYAKLVSTTPGKLVNAYREYDLSRGLEALTATWRWKVSNLKKGEKPWFDARVLFKFKDADGKDLKPEPGPAYQQSDTKGFVSRQTAFLVPPNAARLVIMPCLFQVVAGELEIRDMKVVPSEAAPLRAAAEARERQLRARHVPDEPENRAKWPKEVRVVGNRLVDANGREVWLQGVNAGGNGDDSERGPGDEVGRRRD